MFIKGKTIKALVNFNVVKYFCFLVFSFADRVAVMDWITKWHFDSKAPTKSF